MSVANDIQAFEEALRLAVFAPTEEKAAMAIELAEQIALRLTPEHVAFSKSVVAAQVEHGTYTEEDYGGR